MIADIIFATLALIAGLLLIIVTLLAGGDAPITSQSRSFKRVLSLGGVLTLFGVLYWAHILG